MFSWSVAVALFAHVATENDDRRLGHDPAAIDGVSERWREIVGRIAFDDYRNDGPVRVAKAEEAHLFVHDGTGCRHRRTQHEQCRGGIEYLDRALA